MEHVLGDTRIHDVKKTLFVTSFAVNTNDQQSQTKLDQTQLELLKEGVSPADHDVNIYRCARWHTVFFHNFNDDSQNVKVSDAVMKSTAAPYYFPMVGNCVDGGVAHNNPSLAVVTNMLNDGVDLQDIYVLSFGSGETPHQLNVPDNASLGLIDYAPHFLDMVFDASAEVISQSCKGLLKTRFCRINPIIEPAISLDDANSFDRLLEIAENVDLSKVESWIKEHVLTEE